AVRRVRAVVVLGELAEADGLRLARPVGEQLEAVAEHLPAGPRDDTRAAREMHAPGERRTLQPLPAREPRDARASAAARRAHARPGEELLVVPPVEVRDHAGLAEAVEIRAVRARREQPRLQRAVLAPALQEAEPRAARVEEHVVEPLLCAARR